VLATGGASVRKVNLSDLGYSRKQAAQPVEKKIFGPDAKLDLLRALQVGDSLPIKEGVPLELAQVHVFPTAQQTDYGRSRGLDLDMEVLRKGTQLTATIKLDETLFDSRAEPRLHFGKRRNWLLNLPKWARTIAGQRLVAEADFYKAKTGGEAARSFCLRLAAELSGLQANEFLLQLGWGAGWQSKTLGPLLQRDPRAFEDLVRKYRLSPQDRQRKAGQPFPKSRKLVRRGEKPVEPLGWVKVRLERRA
jgi:CRISPR-associated protein Csm5